MNNKKNENKLIWEKERDARNWSNDQVDAKTTAVQVFFLVVVVVVLFLFKKGKQIYKHAFI